MMEEIKQLTEQNKKLLKIIEMYEHFIKNVKESVKNEEEDLKEEMEALYS